MGALLGSLLAWLLALPSVPHVLVALAAALAAGGLAAMRRPLGYEAHALGWIGAHVGLAYETAWNVQQRASDPSPLARALAAAAITQGQLSIRDLKPPAITAWWLPLATAAIGVWLWSLLAGPPFPALVERTGPTPAVESRGPSGSPADDAESGAPEQGMPIEVPEEQADELARPADPITDAASGAAAGAGDGVPGLEGRATERDTFERFLERLRERPLDEPDTTASAPVASDFDPTREPETPELPASAESITREPVDAARSVEPPAEARTGAERDDAAAPAEAGDEAGVNDSAEAGELGGGTDGELGEGESPAAAGTEPGGEAGAEGDTQTEGALGEEGAGALDTGEPETRGGVGVGAPGSSDATDLSSGEAPEALPSLLGAGPEIPVGGVQLPGVAGEPLPSGSAATYQRRVERALMEGDLPAPYQEVIRSYFR